MPKVYPREASIHREPRVASPTVLTVWTKSLLFNCNGFTVYDSAGILVFRVDNYASHNMTRVVLMDGAGNALLTMRRKRFSFGNKWQGFGGERVKNQKPKFCIRMSLLGNLSMTSYEHSDFRIKGSLYKRSCTICNKSGGLVAEVKRKQATLDVMLGADVFNLVVQPGYDQALIMGLIVSVESIMRKLIIFWK